MAEFSTSFQKGGGLLFDVESLIDLADAAADFVGTPPTTTIEFRGGHKIAGESIEQLLDDSYVRSLPLVSIRISGAKYAPGPRRSVSVRISEDYISRGPVDVDIEGERNASVVTRDRMEKIMEGCVVWYSVFYRPAEAKFAAARLVAAMIFIFTLLFLLDAWLRGLPPTPNELVKRSFILFFSSPGFAALLGLLRNRLYPSLLLDVGKSAARVTSAAYWRNTIFVGLVLAVVASVIATLLTSHGK